jgi:two-component system response regulator DesR
MSPDRNLRVLVVDDHDVVHWGFRLLLTEQPWVERCLTASSVEEALQMARRYEPHVALIDLFLGEESGAELCEAIRRESPHTRILLISGAGWISPQAAKAAGAAGFVSKDWPAHDVAMAVRMVGKGMTVFSPRAEQPSAPLSEREREVLTHMASGATNKEIA